MSDDEFEKAAVVVPEAPEPVGVEDLESVLELTAEFGTAAPAGPTDAALEELKTEVLSAVRGAITGVMNRHQPPTATPDLDLDFSLREPAEEPVPDSLQPETPLPDLTTSVDLVPNPILAALTAEPEPIPAAELAEPPAFTEPALLMPAEPPVFADPIVQTPAEPLVFAEPALQMPVELSLSDHNLPAVAEAAILPVVATRPGAAPRGRVPAWTAAALLSISGVAVGAGAAILLVDPTSTVEIRESLLSKLDTLFANRGPVDVETDEPVLAGARPAAIPPLDAPASESEIAGFGPGALSTMSEEATPGSTELVEASERNSPGVTNSGAPVIALAPANDVEANEPVLAEARPAAIPPLDAPASESEVAGLDPGAHSTTSEEAAMPEGAEPVVAAEREPLGVTYSGAPVIALAPVAMEPEPIVPDLTTLSRAVRVAAAADTAAFAHAFEPPVEISAAVKTVRHATGLDALAALPAPVAIVAPPPTGVETSRSAIKLTKAAKPVPTPEEPPTGAEPTEPAAPLSAMARANEALRNGDVEKARMLLQSESEAGQVEAMLALARSFDPSYLKEIGVAAGKSNAATAEKLYRAWYDQSVKLGLVSEGINLNRLIRAMAKVKP